MRIIVSILPILMFLFAHHAIAQERRVVIGAVDSYSQDRDKVRSIKRSNEYYYYDAIGLDLHKTEIDATQLLAIYIAQQSGYNTLKIDSLLNRYVATEYYINADRYYVCAYVEKSHFVDDDKNISESDIVKPITLADTLALCKNFSELKSELDRLHALHKVMYGRMDKILQIAPCYIAVFNSSADMVAFLEPGEDRRVDVKSGNYVILDDYSEEFKKLWIIVY